MKEENEIIIRCLNKYGKVPETYKLLEKIDLLEEENQRLNNVLNELENFILNHYIVGDKVQNYSLDCILKKLKESDK